MASASEPAAGQVKKIAIAMDGSKHAENALKYFKDNVYEEGDEVILLYAVEYGHMIQQPMFAVDPQLVARQASESQREVEKMVEKLSQMSVDAEVKAKVVRIPAGSNPGHALVHWANENKVTMIVTGTRGQGKLRRTLLGSVSQYIVHHAHVPVLVCPHNH